MLLNWSSTTWGRLDSSRHFSFVLRKCVSSISEPSLDDL